MTDNTPKTLNAEQRLELAKAVNRLVEEMYPKEGYTGQEEALALALVARTRATYPAELFGFSA